MTTASGEGTRGARQTRRIIMNRLENIWEVDLNEMLVSGESPLILVVLASGG